MDVCGLGWVWPVWKRVCYLSFLSHSQWVRQLNDVRSQQPIDLILQIWSLTVFKVDKGNCELPTPISVTSQWTQHLIATVANQSTPLTSAQHVFNQSYPVNVYTVQQEFVYYLLLAVWSMPRRPILQELTQHIRAANKHHHVCFGHHHLLRTTTQEQEMNSGFRQAAVLQAFSDSSFGFIVFRPQK